MPMIEPVSITRNCYAMATKNSGKCGEIKLYGRVVDRRPTDWDGNEIKGDFIIQSEFLEDLNNLKDCSEINISLNTVGGLVSAGITIHNKLREMAGKGVKISCTVDGVAMSAGSLIMCAADTVKAYSSSLIMIHKSSALFFENLNADGLRKAADNLDVYDKAIIAAYKRKTGKDEKKLADLMSAETYMTGNEAKEEGFVDEIIEGATQISASADGSSLIVDGHVLPLFGMKCPDNLPVLADFSQILNGISKPTEKPEGVEDKSKTVTEGGTKMAETTNIPAPAQNDISAEEEQKKIEAAVLAERERLQKIDKIAAQFNSEIVAEAKYSKPCTAEELAYRAALASAEKGTKFLKSVNDDAAASGASNVGAAPEPAEKTEDEVNAEISKAIEDALKEDDE